MSVAEGALNTPDGRPSGHCSRINVTRRIKEMEYHTEMMRRAMLEERILRIECALQLTMETQNGMADRMFALERRVSCFFLIIFIVVFVTSGRTWYCVKKYLYPQSDGELRFVVCRKMARRRHTTGIQFDHRECAALP